MQMVFDKSNGISLGAMVHEDVKDKTALTSYQVDSSEGISPLGVSLKWNHVNMKTHVVRGMPYGTVRFGKDKKNSFVLPTILSGDRPKSILIDSDGAAANLSKDEDASMLCGTFTGESVDQDPSRAAPITSNGKPKEYTVQNEIIFHLDQSDFTWIVFFSKPVKVQCYSDVVPAVSVAGPVEEVQFRLDVTEVNDTEGDDEVVVRVALLNECTTGHGIIKEHCDHLASLGYETVSSEKTAEQYLSTLRKGKSMYSKSPLVGTEFPDENNEEKEDRVTNVVFDWDVTSVYGDEKGAGDNTVATSSMTASSLRTPSIDTRKDAESDSDFFMFALPHHMQTLTESGDTAIDSSSPLCIHSFHGRTCLVNGSVWNLPVSHGKPQSFLADRPPAAKAIPALADAVNKDIKFDLSPNIFRGAADTYFLVSYSICNWFV